MVSLDLALNGNAALICHLSVLIFKTSGWPKINSLKHLTVNVNMLTLSWGIAFWAMVFNFSSRDRKLCWVVLCTGRTQLSADIMVVLRLLRHIF